MFEWPDIIGASGRRRKLGIGSVVRHRLYGCTPMGEKPLPNPSNGSGEKPHRRV